MKIEIEEVTPAEGDWEQVTSEIQPDYYVFALEKEGEYLISMDAVVKVMRDAICGDMTREEWDAVGLSIRCTLDEDALHFHVAQERRSK